MSKFDKIRKLLNDYKEKADSLIDEFGKAENRARERYSQSAFREELNLNIFPKYAGQIRAEADWSIQEINEVFDELEEEFKEWVNKPIDYQVAQMLDSINKFDLILSLPELKAIESKITQSYFGQRIFAGIAKKSGYSITNMPNMKECMDALRDARSKTEFALKAYAGQPPFAGKELLEDWVYNGVNQGRYELFHHITAMSYINNSDYINELETLFQAQKAPIEYELTADERKINENIKTIMNNGVINEEAAAKLVENDPGFSGKLESFLDDEASHGYGKEVEGREELERHFHIGKYESGFDLQEVKVPEGASSRVQADENILNQYM